VSWPASIAVSILTGIVGLVAGGLVAGLAVEWYRISSFEGGAGYFVVGLALLAGLVGAILGLATSRLVAGSPDPGFLKSLAIASGLLLGTIGAIGGIARLLADIPPEIDGDQLFLAFELQWPAGAEDPRNLPGLGYARLGASSGGVMRKSEPGVLFTADASLADGRWRVPGAAPVFTSRSKRVLLLGVGEQQLAGFEVPLPGHPGPDQQRWSEWLPRARPGSPPLPDGFRYRFRVLRQSEPLRTDTIGPFVVSTISGYFFQAAESDALASNSTFRIAVGNQPIVVDAEFDGVAVLPGASPALLVQTEGNHLYLIATEGDSTPPRSLGTGGSLADAKLITADSALFRSTRRRTTARGWIDHQTFSRPGLYDLGNRILDTRDRAAYPLEDPEGIYPLDTPGLIGLSPDEQSVVWLAHQGSEEMPVLGVTDFRANASYRLPIDRRRMRYNHHADLDPGWVAHHFEWQRAAGADRLAERKGFVPLAYRGDLTVGKAGEYASYDLRPAGTPLRDTLVEILVREFAAERLDDEPGSYQRKVRIDGKVLTVSAIASGSSGFVSVGTEYRQADPALMTRIATRVDALLATREYDSLFAPPD
jgi:hypothetical protein